MVDREARRERLREWAHRHVVLRDNGSIPNDLLEELIATETAGYDLFLKALCDCNFNYPYASEDCPHRSQARKMVKRLYAGS